MALGWGWRIQVAVFLAGFVPALPAAQAVATPAPARAKSGEARDAQAAAAVAEAPKCKPGTRTSAYKLLSTFRDCADTPEMVRLPGGKFRMGETSDMGLTYEQPVHEVTVPSISIGKYEVTFLEWDACYADRFCQKRPDDKGWGRGYRPVLNVSWVDAQQYVTWLSRKTGQRYRLPSEAEWEYAARAGTETRFYWGDSSYAACDFANTFDVAGHAVRPNWYWSMQCLDGFRFTAPTGSFPPNPWGLFDMAGNVWEWVQDCWHSDYTGAPSDSSPWLGGNDADCEKRVNRGGGWGNHPRTLRSAKRDADSATGYGDGFGFRIARDHAPDEVESPAKAVSAPSSAGTLPPKGAP